MIWGGGWELPTGVGMKGYLEEMTQKQLYHPKTHPKKADTPWKLWSCAHCSTCSRSERLAPCNSAGLLPASSTASVKLASAFADIQGLLNLQSLRQMISVQRKLPKDKGISCSPWYIGSARRCSIVLCSEKVGTHDPHFFREVTFLVLSGRCTGLGVKRILILDWVIRYYNKQLCMW